MNTETLTLNSYLYDFEISNSCTCRGCLDCGILTESELCDECQKETTPADNCWGECYEYKLEWLDDLVSEYSRGNGHDYLMITGHAIGWQRLSGQTDVIPATGESVLKVLTFSGDWIIRFRLDSDNNFTMSRYSHDEPTGANFIAVPANLEDGE